MVVKKIISKMLGDPSVKFVKSVQPIVNRINELEEEYQKLSEEAL